MRIVTIAASLAALAATPALAQGPAAPLNITGELQDGDAKGDEDDEAAVVEAASEAHGGRSEIKTPVAPALSRSGS